MKRIRSVMDRIIHRLALRHWRRAGRVADHADLASLRRLRARARELRRLINIVLHRADARLTLPLIGSNVIDKPLHADWAWRPELWRGPVSPQGIVAVRPREELGREVTLFHDCSISELTLRQIRNTREEDFAPFGLRMDVFRFDGSFLSLAIDLPKEAVRGLKKRHIIRLNAIAECERPLEIFARLNIRHGPNTEQVVRELPMDGQGEMIAEFDLAYTNINEKRVERAWVDLIFESPEMNQIVLRDITLSRRPRAEL